MKRIGPVVLAASAIFACGRYGFETHVPSHDAGGPPDASSSDAQRDGAGPAPSDGGSLPPPIDAASPCADGGCAEVVLERAYPGFGWTEWVTRDAPAAPAWAQGGTPCPSEAPRAGCVHAGELFRVRLPDEPDCASLTATDALDAFTWTCTVEEGIATLYSRGLSPDVAFGELVTAEGFLPNHVSIRRDGTLVAATPPQHFWDNPVQPLPDNSGPQHSVVTLATPRAVYVLDRTRASAGYNLAADAITVVTRPGATLELAEDAPPSCNVFDGGTEPPNPPDDQDPLLWRSCLLSAGSAERLWIEGRFDAETTATRAGDATTAIYWKHVRRSTVRKAGIQNGSYGVLLYGSSDNRLLDLRLANQGRYGLLMGNGLAVDADVPSSRNVVHRVRVTNAGSPLAAGYGGVVLEGHAEDNVLTHVFVAGSMIYGLLAVQSAPGRHVFSHVTVLGAAWGTSLRGGDDLGFAQALVANTSGRGFELSGTTNAWIGNLVAGYGDRSVIRLEGNTDTTFAQNLAIGPAGGTACWGCPPDLSPLVTTFDSFVGAVASDVENGASTFPREAAAVEDWLRFEHPFRAWATDGASVLDRALAAPCTGSCRIYDFRPAGDTVLVGRSGDFETRETFAPGAACPAAVDPDTKMATGVGGGQSFLINALELLADGLGDEDGLCEAGESCRFSPHVGAYQGFGVSAEPCTMAALDALGIRMFGPRTGG